MTADEEETTGGSTPIALGKSVWRASIRASKGSSAEEGMSNSCHATLSVSAHFTRGVESARENEGRT